MLTEINTGTLNTLYNGPQMENYLFRNHETRKYVQEQAYRLQQGIVTTTTQQVRTSPLSSHTETETHVS